MSISDTARRLQEFGFLSDHQHLAVRDGNGYTLWKNSAPSSPPEDDLQTFYSEVFSKHRQVNVILLSTSPYARACSHRGKSIPPLLDDAAQLLGARLRIARGPLSHRVARYPAVLLPSKGVLCFSSSLYDIEAIALVCEKLAIAAITTDVAGSSSRIPFHEALLMRLIYTFSYGKKGTNSLENHHE